MKVLLINTVCGKGSTGRIVTDIYSALEQQGDQCLIAYGRGNAPENVRSYRIGSDAGVYWHAALSRLTDRAGFYSRRATLALIEQIKAFSPDLIHLHNLHGYYLHVGALLDFLKRYDRPVIFTLHDCWAFTGHCTHFSFAGCDKWKSECGDCPEKGRYPASLFADRSRRNFAEKKSAFCGLNQGVVLTVSDWLKRMAEQSYLGEYPVKRIYNGIDLSLFRPVESSIKQELGIAGKRMILSVSDGWDERKGLSDILEASKSAGPDTVFVVVGLSPKQIARMPDNVLGMERTWNLEQLIKLYSAADLFLNPSKEETFGMVTAEALACGTPAVVYDRTACPEVVDGSCGVVARNREELIRAIDRTDLKREDAVKRAALFERSGRMRELLQVYETLGQKHGGEV